ncbi:centrosomal protein of 135 kDa isoform X2 [Drosophila obscura]|uniref:centrosomal protein of 135 kDa isoform X2 n=1 Tax=Drosophila obscura TaxID=7282 RepID=UPI001BB24678|nr:centrosomal protein of 135 kDa isoform X2 [Drosophila obscura]
MNGFNDGDFKDLRSKLDVMGFNQTLPVLAIPLVQGIFGDLVKTTECLRDTKKQVSDLLEEKTCWELGVEPYKCDNSRLLAECNELHLQFLRDREDYELRLCEAERRMRSLETDKEHLQSHNVGLQNQLDALLSKQLVSSTTGKRTHVATTRQTKKPFITTVRSGNVLPCVLGTVLKCTKCNAGVFQKTTTTTQDGVTVTQTSGQEELDKLQNDLATSSEQLEFYKRKVESRNREIRRLNDMLSGGRPPAALAKDCCYKEVGALSEDIDLLQREKSELMMQVREYQDKMHDAMQRAVRSDEDKRKLQMNLDELKQAALQVEEQANLEIDARELEVKHLQVELKQLQQRNEQKFKDVRLTGGAAPFAVPCDNRNLNERLNLLTRREEELNTIIDKQKKKLSKMHVKISELQKEAKDHSQHNSVTLDEEKIRLASERDFFQKEYLRMMSRSGSESELAFLRAQIKSKDEELRTLRNELCSNKLQYSPQKTAHYEPLPLPPSTASGSETNSNRSDCVQAAIGRVERERDCARSELERFRCERDMLREKQLCSLQLHSEELLALRQRNEDLNARLRQLERDNKDLNSARLPAETNIALLKEDIAQMKQRITSLQAEIEQLKTENGQITMLNEQNERIIADFQSKLMISERQRHSADVRASTLDSSRESNRNEVTHLRSEIGALRQTYITLENEKDTLLHQLDSKTERAYKLEYELKDCKEKRNCLEQRVKELEDQVRKLSNRNRQCDSELNETSTESKTLRQQIVALKASRDEAIAENGRLMDVLSDAQVEARTLQTKLKESELRVANMKQQLHKYVQEVKKAEDLLLQKERERDELLDNFHSLTNEQVVLEGNNQSLECEAAESKRQICELECEMRILKDHLQCCQCKLKEMEVQLTAARATARCLERELENARDDLRIQKVDLEARRELCEKLDVEKEKLNAELNEVNEIRKKLERQCEKLRDELHQTAAVNQVATETTDQLLENLHQDQQRQDDDGIRTTNEMDRLRHLYQHTMEKLQEERARCTQQELLATKYEEQLRELRKNLDQDRFCRARTREVSPRVPSETL